MTARLIQTADCIAEGCDWLCRVEPRFSTALEVTGPPPLRRREAGFAAMLDIICGQQLSVAAADAVWARLKAAGADDPAVFDRLADDDLRACGLSRPKIRTGRAVIAAAPDWEALERMPEDEAIGTLTAIHGIGPWTAEIYLMFSVGRADVLAAGDLALQEAARLLFDLETRPTDKGLRALATPWSPWRGVAARLLWAYYREAKNRPGLSEGSP